MIAFEVVQAGQTKLIEVPEGINLSLMEVLKASDYPILATCGGMALCATCQVEVLVGLEKLHAPSDPELEMLDQLPESTPATRLACQIKLGTNLNNLKFKI